MNKYKLLLKEITPFLKKSNYKKSGDSFFCNKENNIALINFQKSRSNTVCSFTINLGVYSNALKIFDNFDVKSKPSISDCHWRKRIGYLMQNKEDHWWELDDGTLLSKLIIEIINILKLRAIPEIEKFISDENLVKHWTQGNGEGLTEPQMYLYLISLLKTHNSPNLQSKIYEIKEKSKGKPFYNNVMENLLKIGITDV